MKEEWKNIKDRYWGNGSEQWIMLSTGDDIELSPRQSATTAEDQYPADKSPQRLAGLNDDGTLNYFVYPYVEYDGQFNRAYYKCVPGMAQVLRVKVPSRVFTAKCSEPQAENSNV